MERLGVDTEADSRHHYPEKVCLIQIAAGDLVYIVDPLAPLDVGLLRAVLEDRRVEKIFHGADFDLRGLNRDWGFEVNCVYDTNVAARFAGLERFGLAALIEDLLGHIIPKDQRLQRADWSKRPLSDVALDYAAADVAHLAEVRDALDSKLRELGRQGWVAEELERFEQIRYVPPDPETAFLSVRGSNRLDDKGRGILKSLFELREAEARRLDRPTAFVLPAETLVYISAHPDTDLTEVRGIGPSTVRRLGPAIRMAVQAGLDTGPVRRPMSERGFRARPSAARETRLKRLKEWRIKTGEILHLDPSLLWPMRNMERLAREPEAVDAEVSSPQVRRWQRAEFEGTVRGLLE